MARCNCNSQVCGCNIEAGSGISIVGSGTVKDKWIISAESGGGSSATGWSTGDLKDTVASTTPAGWLECNGQAVNRSSYADLFAAIGTTWGAGDGVNTFNVPNFAGRFRIGVGAGYSLAASGGSTDMTLGVDNLPPHHHTTSHTHTMNHSHGNVESTKITHDHGIPFQYTDNTSVKDGDKIRVTDIDNKSGGGGDGATARTNNDVTSHTHKVPSYTGNTGGASSSTSGNTGGGASFSILPPYRAVRVLIKT